MGFLEEPKAGMTSGKGLSKVRQIIIQVHIIFFAGICRQNADTAAVGNDDGIFSLGDGRIGQVMDTSSEHPDGLGADDAALLDNIVEDPVFAGQRTGMGSGGHSAPARTGRT